MLCPGTDCLVLGQSSHRQLSWVGGLSIAHPTLLARIGLIWSGDQWMEHVLARRPSSLSAAWYIG